MKPLHKKRFNQELGLSAMAPKSAEEPAEEPDVIVLAMQVTELLDSTCILRF